MASNATGTLPVSFTVTDGDGQDASETVSLVVDTGPSLTPVASTSSVRLGVPVTVATVTGQAGLESVDVLSGASKGTVALSGGTVVYTPTKAVSLDQFTYKVTDVLGVASATGTAIIGGDKPESVQGGAGLTTVILGDGADTVTLAGTNNAVDLGNGTDTVRGGKGDATVTVGNGRDHIQLGGGNNTVTAGNGADTVEVGGTDNTIHLGSGSDSVYGGSGDTISLEGLGGALTLSGKNETVFLGLGRDTVVSSAPGLTIGVSKADLQSGLFKGADISGACDPFAVHLNMPVGVTAITYRDGHGGETVQLGSGQRLDFSHFTDVIIAHS